MRIALLTKRTTPEMPFHKYLARVINFLADTGNEVGIRYTPVSPDCLCKFDHALSFLYRTILDAECLRSPRYGVSNLHPALLPSGRGSCPNCWAIIEESPAGATWHWMTEEIDGGNILAQKEVVKSPVDTGETLYWRTIEACSDVFIENWPAFAHQIVHGVIPEGRPQNSNLRPHKMKDLERIDDLGSQFGEPIARHLVNILRARTFSGCEAAFVRDEHGKKIYVRVSLEYAPQ